MVKKLSLSFIISYVVLFCSAQTNFQSKPQIGKTFIFTLDSVENYSKKAISLIDFKGKWIFLDFWGQNCIGCINSFPKINELQKKYQSKVQFILVTVTQNNPLAAMSLFKKLNEKLGLTIPVSYDQDFVNRVGPSGLPTTIVISPQGIVETIIQSPSAENIEDIVNGKKPKWVRYYLGDEQKPYAAHAISQPLLINGNGGNETDYLFRSILTKWTSSVYGGFYCDTAHLEALGKNLKDLYRIAYLGRDFWAPTPSSDFRDYYFEPILEVKDSSLFNSDFDTKTNYFNYSLCFPPGFIDQSKSLYSKGSLTLNEQPRLMAIMQRDLQNYFNFTAVVEQRNMPCLKLVATKDAYENKLKTKGGTSSVLSFNSGGKIIAQNISIKRLIENIYKESEYPKPMPIIDGTGIKGNIDININGVFYDDWVTELHKNGLDLVPDSTSMKVLVIKDI